MPEVGTESNPLRVAIVGAGPAGFYAAERLLKDKSVVAQVDMYDRLATPFGLVRHGVAPDHAKIKSVTKLYDRIAARPGFRFFGNVEIGAEVTVADLRKHYHQIIYTTGAQTDRRLNIPGIDLENSRTATEFVAWYNGHPDYRHLTFDLSQERVAVIGVGNVAIDVARILCRTPAELAQTDIAGYALDALACSRVKEVIMIGRRGPAQAAFTPPEIRELGELEDADIIVSHRDATPDPISQAWLDDRADRAAREAAKTVKVLQEYAASEPQNKGHQLHIRFLASPTELVGDAQGRVVGMRIVRNELYQTESGTMRPRPTDETDYWQAGLVFRSIGYHGVPIPGVPFRQDWGIIPNDKGRICDMETGQIVVGEYVAGWIKRGPSGIIGTNKPDAVETVEAMLADLAAGQFLCPSAPCSDEARDMVSARQPSFITYDDWLRLDELEIARGAALGRPRLKFVSTDEILEALGR